MRVDDHALDVGEVCVVLQRPHVQAGLLAQLRDARPVVVRQGGVCQDGVRHLGVRHQVDLQQLRHTQGARTVSKGCTGKQLLDSVTFQAPGCHTAYTATLHVALVLPICVNFIGQETNIVPLCIVYS